MKQTIKRSLGVSVLMGVLVLILPYLAPPKLVLRLLPKDIYEAGKDHPAPSRKRQLLGHILTLTFLAYFIRIMKKNADEIKQESLCFTEAFKRLVSALLPRNKGLRRLARPRLEQQAAGSKAAYLPDDLCCAGTSADKGSAEQAAEGKGIKNYPLRALTLLCACSEGIIAYPKLHTLTR